MFNIPEQLARLYKAYDELPNYKVVAGEGPQDTVYVFFSSKGLFNENSFEDFTSKILMQDRYEWENVICSPELRKAAGTFIFVRDIRMNDWLTGINGTDNTPEKVMQRLQKLCAGKQHCIFCGSSMGGFAALLFGTMLAAERIFVFSPIVELDSFNRVCISEGAPVRDTNHHATLINDPNMAAYIAPLPQIAEYSGVLYWFYPNQFAYDVSQYDLVKENPHIRFFSVNRHQHGSTIPVESIIRVISESQNRLDVLHEKYKGKRINPLLFLRDTHGSSGAFAILLRRFVKKLRKKQHI